MMRRYVLALLSLCEFLFSAEARSADNNCIAVVCVFTSPPSLIPEQFQPFINAAKDISSVYSGITDAIKILQLLGFIKPDLSNQALFDKLDTELKEGVGIEYDAEVLKQLDDAIIDMTTAAHQAGEALKDDPSLDINNPLTALRVHDADVFSDKAVGAFRTTHLQFTRVYNDSLTDGGTGWKSIIPDRDSDRDNLPDQGRPKIVFDWRAGLAHYMIAIAIRLKAYTVDHPAWREDGHRDDQLEEIAENLLFRLHQMLDGVRCDSGFFSNGSHLPLPPPFDIAVNDTTAIACADIYTGISSVEILPYLLGDSARAEITESLYRSVLLQLPIYELRSMIDTLHLYLSHAPDLTATLQRIPVERPPASPGSPVLGCASLCRSNSPWSLPTSSCCCRAPARIDSGWSTRVLRSRMILKPPPGCFRVARFGTL